MARRGRIGTRVRNWTAPSNPFTAIRHAPVTRRTTPRTSATSVIARARHRHDRNGRHRPAALAEAHAEIEQRPACRVARATCGGPGSAEQWPTMQWSSAAGSAKLSGSTADVTTYPSSTTGIERRRAATVAAAIAISSAPPTSRMISIGSVTPAMRRTASCDGGALAGEALVVDAGAAPDPRRGLAAGERGGDGGRRRGVADADLAEHEQVGVERVDGGDRHGDDLVEPFRRHRRFVADVAGRVADADVDRLDRRPGVAGERADRRSALAEGGEHRRGDGGRVGADLGRARRRRGRRRRSARPVGRPAGVGLRCQPATHVRRSRRAAQARRSGAGCWPPARAPRRLRQRRVAGGRRGRRAASSSAAVAGDVELTRAPLGDRRARVPDRRRATAAGRRAAAQIWLTRPSTSRYCLPERRSSGCTPRPTSLVMTTVGAARAAAAVAASAGGVDDRRRLVVAALEQVARPRA